MILRFFNMKSMQKKILICGGCGFMGSHFIRHLYNKYPDYIIYNFDLLTYAGNLENLKDIEDKEKQLSKNKKRYFFVQGDINDKVLLEELLGREKFDIAINFAAESHVDRSIHNAIEFIKTNIQGAYILLDTLRTTGIPRYVYISTDEVYGDIPPGVHSDENYPIQPVNPYSASKASADLMVQSYIKTHKMPAIILRSSNNYGTNQYPEKLHALVITNLLEKKKIPLHGKGNHIRSWLHVLDFCNALDLIMHNGRDFQVYNISGEEKSTLEVVSVIAKLFGLDPGNYITYVADRPGPDYRYSPDHSKITKELGWQSKYKHSEAIPDIISWYRKNKTWWEHIKKKAEFEDYYAKIIQGHYTFEETKNYKRHWSNKGKESK